MTKVVELDDFRPHVVGVCVCMRRRFDWVACAPEEANLSMLECKNCGSMDNLFISQDKLIYNTDKDCEITAHIDLDWS